MGDDESGPDGLRWFLKTEYWPVAYARETVTNLLVIAAVVLVLFGISGVWPPLVAVESGSMEPHISEGDLLFVMDEHRFAPSFATSDTGVVTHDSGAKRSYRTFGSYGDVVVFRSETPRQRTVIHRARFWVNESENWYGKANESYLSGGDCGEVPNCPAPHAGFITKGDGNELYDQASGVSSPVPPSRIRGTAEVRVPYLGYGRILFDPSSPANPL